MLPVSLDRARDVCLRALAGNGWTVSGTGTRPLAASDASEVGVEAGTPAVMITSHRPADLMSDALALDMALVSTGAGTVVRVTVDSGWARVLDLAGTTSRPLRSLADAIQAIAAERGAWPSAPDAPPPVPEREARQPGPSGGPPALEDAVAIPSGGRGDREPALPSGGPTADPRGGHASLFLSYRRDDSADVTGRIYDRLIARYGRDAVFKDVDSIPLGVDFRRHLSDAVGRCKAVLVVIGRQWVAAADEVGRRRLDDPADLVRIEVETALERDIPVVPLLVQGAVMPRPEELPSSMRDLAWRNGTPIKRDPDFHPDVDRLIEALDRVVTR
jgi:hypothetical protein